MIEERRIGANEARLGLAIIFGLLLALGAVFHYRVSDATRVSSDAAELAPRMPPPNSDVQQASYAAQWLPPADASPQSPSAPTDRDRYAPRQTP